MDAIPTDADKKILRLIISLTAQEGGKPPTMAEIATAAGLQISSRSNIQRQLARLRPAYIDWSASPRSLHITPSGLAALGMSGQPSPVEEMPVSDTILPLLASGLTAMLLDLEGGKPLQSPYPTAWQRGLNILARECFLRGVAPPTHTAAAISWCHLPTNRWPVSFREQSRFLDDPLLVDDEPTEFCRELARSLQGGEAEQELTERILGDLRHETELAREQGAYVAIRRYVIEQPVVSQQEQMLASFDPAMKGFGNTLDKMYERVPVSIAEHGQVLLCGNCGWTLSRQEGRLRCGADRCRILTENFTRGTVSLPFLTEAPLMRVRRAIRRYIVAPGRYEVSAFRRLSDIGVGVELWPSFDRYDLRIAFADGEHWAVDVKDWRYPHLLARQLLPLRSDSASVWDRAFYAVPDARVQEKPSYLTFLRSVSMQQDFTVVTVSELIELVRQRKQVSHG